MKNKKFAFFAGILITIAVTIIAFLGLGSLKGATQMRYGIDVRGGVEAVYAPDGINRKATPSELEAARTVIETRMDAKNITDREVTVDKQNSDIIVRFPWKSNEKQFNPEKAISELGETSRLTFQDANGNVLVDGSTVAKSSVAKSKQDGRPVVNLTFNEKGTALFAKATKELVGQTITIYMDKKKIFGGTVQNQITNGEAIIEGLSSTEEAQDLSQKINAGALPFSMKTSNYNIISPTLGKGALQTMLYAGLVAFIFVCLYMLIIYKLPGFIACIALIFQMAFQFLLLSGPQFTLTLPGMAGLILSLGMGVDANIIISERMGEELKKGKSTTSAIVEGYKHAFGAVFDGNLTTAIVAAILMIFGSGTMLSFGYNLLTGVILNFTNIFITKRMLLSAMEFKPLNKEKMFKTRKEMKVLPWYKKRAIAYVFSIAVIGIGLGLGFTGRLSLDTQFIGGSILKYSYTGDVDTKACEKIALDTTGRPATIQTTKDISNQGMKLVVTLAGNKGLSPEKQAALKDGLVKANPKANMTLSESSIVEPYIGARALKDSALALIISSLFIILYVWFRFKAMGVSAGVMAMVSLFHDVLIVLAVFILFKIPINDAFIAVALTIIGYSINDTIVMYDRVRENRSLDRSMPVADLVEASISQTLVRTINTSTTTTVCMLIILVFSLVYNIDSIRVFSLPMFFGLLSGCYSTICIAGPLWVTWQQHKEKKGNGKKAIA